MSRKIGVAIGVGILAAAVVVAVLIIPFRSGKNVVTFGAVLPLTGYAASFGQKAMRGINLAVEEYNARGGLLGRRIKVDFQDDVNDKQKAVNIVIKFTTIDKVPVIFGAAGSTVTLAIAPITTRNKVILISPISTSSVLSVKGGPFFFRTCPVGDVQARMMAKWVWESGYRRVALVFTNNSWGRPLSDAFTRYYKAKGGSILLTEGVPENTADLRTILTKIKNLSNVQAIVSPTYHIEGGNLVRQAKELGIKLPIFGGDWYPPEFLLAARGSAEGVLFLAPTVRKSEVWNSFTRRLKQKYGVKPDAFTAYAYDAAQAICRAILAAGSFDPLRIREALLKLKFVGASGIISFLSNGDLAEPRYRKMTIKHGKVVPLIP